MGDIPAQSATREVHHHRLYYGWVLVGSLAGAQVTSWGVLYYAFSVFLDPMQRELGWTRAELTGAYSLALLVSGVAAFPIGAWLDRHGPRLLMTVGSLAAALLVYAWASATNRANLAAFYLIWAGIGLAMAAVLYEPAFVVVATWFARRRGRALTLLTFIGGFASIVYIPLATWLVGAQGWRGALVTLAVALAVLTLPVHALLLRRRPSDLGLAPDGDRMETRIETTSDAASTHRGARESRAATSLSPTAVAGRAALPGVPLGAALRASAFWRLTLAFVLGTLTAVAITVHLIPYLIGLGYGADFAALVVSLIGIIALPGRAIFTPLGDFVPRRFVSALIFLLQAAGLAVLLLVPGVVGILVFAVLFGVGFGAIAPARAALVADLYGPAQYGRINGVLAAALMGARALAPVGVSLLYQQFAGYLPALWMLAALSLVAALVIATVAQRSLEAQHATTVERRAPTASA
jgi:MFS family permease